MKVSGPKGPGSVPPPAAGCDEKPPPVAEASFRELLETPAAAPAEGPLAGAYAEIAARLRAGEIDGTRASELLVEAVLRAQLPQAAPRIQAQLREALQRMLREDPVLAARVRSLGEGER